MRRKQVQILVYALVALFVLAAAGCGGKKKAATTTETTTTTVATTTTTAAATTSSSTSTMAHTTTSAASGLGALTSSANCAQLSNVGQAFAQAMQGASGDLPKSAEIFKKFADATPSDIKPDFEVVAAALQKYADALKGVDLTSGKVPDAATIAKLTKLSTELDTAALTKAETNISTWASKNCHA